jgi:lipoate-protein ligase A
MALCLGKSVQEKKHYIIIQWNRDITSMAYNEKRKRWHHQYINVTYMEESHIKQGYFSDTSITSDS